MKYMCDRRTQQRTGHNSVAISSVWNSVLYNDIILWSKVLPEKLIVAHIFNKLGHRKRKCITGLLEPVPDMNHMNTVCNLTNYCFKINNNIRLPSTPGSSKWSFHFRISDGEHVCIRHLFNSCLMFYRLILLAWIILVLPGETDNLRSVSSSKYFQAFRCVLSIRSRYIPVFAGNIYSSLNMRDRPRHSSGG
jgi:hypothetical protein